jgi:hypothetical protein
MAAIVVVVVCATAGTLAAGAWWWYRPRLYVSSAVLRPQTTDSVVVQEAERHALGDYSLASIIERHGLYAEVRKKSGMSAAIRQMRNEAIRVQEAESLGPVIVLSFRYDDATGAQTAMSDLVTAMQATMKSEVLEPASMPLGAENESGALPLAGAGFGGGLIAGLVIAGIWWAVRKA